MFERICRKAFPKSLWVYHTNTGACNGCDIEVICVLTPYYDAERFGIKLVGSPQEPSWSSPRRKPGFRVPSYSWIPAFAGMTYKRDI